MPEVIMPAAASIAGFTMAAITWYGALRTGIQTLHDDIKATKSYEPEVRDMVEDLRRQERQLKDWRRLWHIWDGLPDHACNRLWGEDEARHILTKLENMARNLKHTQKELERYTSLTPSKWKATNALLRKWLKMTFVFAKRKYVRALLDELVKNLDAIKSAAEDGWQRDSLFEKGVDPSQVYHKVVGNLLVSFAIHTGDDTRRLDECWTSIDQTLDITIHLDLFDVVGSLPAINPEASLTSSIEAREKHFTNVVEATQNKRMKWKISGGSLASEGMSFARLIIEEASSHGSACTNAQTALRSLMMGHSREGHISLQGKQFRIGVAEGTFDVTLERRSTLRELMETNSGPWVVEQHPLGDVAKLRVVFELSQACLLLLRTPWLASICSCRLQCEKIREAPPEFAYEFGLRVQVGETERHGFGIFTDNAVDPWSTESSHWNFYTRRLRRTGLLMIECLLGIALIKVRCDEMGAVSSIYFKGEYMATSDVLDRVYSALKRSETCKRAISYCLVNLFPEAPTDVQLVEALSVYYTEVVSPLKDHFDRTLENHLRKRRDVAAVRAAV